MENLNNPIEETKIDAPEKVEDIVETKEVTPEPAKVEDAPKVEEAPKAEESKEAPTAIKTDDFGKSSVEQQAVGRVANGAIGVTTAPKSAPKVSTKSTEKKETVAVRSTKNVAWGENGKVIKGINILPKDKADIWLEKPYITLVSPEEVAKEYGL